MPYSVDYSTQFKRSLKLCKKRGLDIEFCEKQSPSSWKMDVYQLLIVLIFFMENIRVYGSVI